MKDDGGNYGMNKTGTLLQLFSGKTAMQLQGCNANSFHLREDVTQKGIEHHQQRAECTKLSQQISQTFPCMKLSLSLGP
jgi:hypothetical protein